MRVFLRPACFSVFIKVSWIKNRAVPLLAGLLNTQAKRPRFRRTTEVKVKRKKEGAKEKTEDEITKYEGNYMKSRTGRIV